MVCGGAARRPTQREESAPAEATLVPRPPWEPPSSDITQAQAHCEVSGSRSVTRAWARASGRSAPACARKTPLRSHNTGGGFLRYRETIAVVGVGLLLSLVAADAQTCDQSHYRWSEKIDESLASLTPQRVSITTILTTWDT